jgi:hypothetical protein
VTFSTFFVANSLYSTSFILDSSLSDQKLSQNVCKIINDVTKSSSDTQDILIGNLGSHTWSSTVNDIAECVNDDKALLVSDLRYRIEKENLRKFSIVVLVMQKADVVSFFFKLKLTILEYFLPPITVYHIFCLSYDLTTEHNRQSCHQALFNDCLSSHSEIYLHNSWHVNFTST